VAKPVRGQCHQEEFLETDPKTRAMEPGLTQLYDELLDDFDWLRRKWSEFQELYGKGQERIDVLNAAASNFFYLLQQVFFENAMLHLSRLTDRPRMAGHETLSILALPDLISDPTLKAAVQAKVAVVQDRCEFARAWRDRHIAHKDLQVLRQGHASTLPQVDGTKVDDAIKSLRELLLLIGDHYGRPHTMLGPDPWGAKSLVSYLKRAKRAIDEERQRWKDAVKGKAANNS
jgi:hypothetical protein